MFTGLIEKMGTVEAVDEGDGGARLRFSFSPWDTPLEMGESMSVDGVCLTVTEFSETAFSCDLLQETWSRTCLNARQPKARVNLERALRVGDRMGGHYVSGHVDCTGAVKSVVHSGEDYLITIDASKDFMKGVVFKGSVTVTGISLTVAELSDSEFVVCIIPHTWSHTNVQDFSVGDAVNLEADLIGKHVVRYLEAAGR